MSGRGDTPVTGALVGSLSPTRGSCHGGDGGDRFLLPSGSHPELKDQAVPHASVRGRAQS